MKFKYKKAILFILISTMGIGIVTISIAPNNHKAKESMKYEVEKDTDKAVITDTPVTPTQGTQGLPVVTVTSMPTPTTAPLPVYDLKEDGYPEITEFFQLYYKAKLDCDLDQLKKMFTDTTGMPTKKQLKDEVQFINEYKKIKCYVKKGYLEGTYIAFVSYEIKYMNIDTPAPAITQFYLVTEEDESLRIFSGEFDEETLEYYNARKQDADVLKLKKATDKKVKKALAKDETLKVFWNKLLELQGAAAEDGSAE